MKVHWVDKVNTLLLNVKDKTFISLEKAVSKMATGWLKMVKMDIFALGN